jgi:hypothetical protein
MQWWPLSGRCTSTTLSRWPSKNNEPMKGERLPQCVGLSHLGGETHRHEILPQRDPVDPGHDSTAPHCQVYESCGQYDHARGACDCLEGNCNVGAWSVVRGWNTTRLRIGTVHCRALQAHQQRPSLLILPLPESGTRSHRGSTCSSYLKGTVQRSH